MKYEPYNIYTFPNGTVVEYYLKPQEKSSDGIDRYLYFFDANNNQKLDAGDKKHSWEVGYDLFETGGDPGPVTQEDIKKFGKDLGEKFKKAQTERSYVRQLKALNEGQVHGECWVWRADGQGKNLLKNRVFSPFFPRDLSFGGDQNSRYSQKSLPAAGPLNFSQCISAASESMEVSIQGIGPMVGLRVYLGVFPYFYPRLPGYVSKNFGLGTKPLPGQDPIEVTYRVPQSPSRIHVYWQ